jgi:hypothetical protein
VNCTGKQRDIRVIGLQVVVVPSAVAAYNDTFHDAPSNRR